MIAKKSISIAVFALSFSLAFDAFARANRVDQVPNNEYGCDLCHNSTGGLTDFGFDSFDHTVDGDVQWAGLAAVDSDRDGYSNGLELGDPNGEWRIGDPDPTGPTTDPRDPTDNFCGNGNLEPEEECDGTNLNSATCDSLGFAGGNLACDPESCTFDVGGCGESSCGDGIKQQTEDCEDGDLGGATCESLGFDGGALSCSSQCTFDTLSCSGSNGSDGPGFSLCGDGLQTGSEECDAFDLDGETCVSLGYDGGPLSCRSDCTFNLSRCEGTPPGAEPEVEDDPADEIESDSATSMGAIEADDSGQMQNSVEFEGRACTAASGDLAPVTLVLGLFGILGWSRRRR